MSVNKRKKNSRQRGSHTYGWGSMKKHRGLGNRGGAGAAGTGKRADSNKPSIWHIKKYFGKYGFVNRGAGEKAEPINVSILDENAEALASKKLATAQEGGFAINLKDLGFTKLLSKGKVSKKLFLTCESASRRAIEAVESAGGKVTTTKKGDTSNGTEGHPSKSS